MVYHKLYVSSSYVHEFTIPPHTVDMHIDIETSRTLHLEHFTHIATIALLVYPLFHIVPLTRCPLRGTDIV